MSVIALASASTQNYCADLVIKDLMNYGISNHKSTYTSRQVTITKVDGTVTTTNWPYTNTDDTIQDTLTKAGFFTKDYYVTIKVDYGYNNGSDQTATVSFNYISTCFIVKTRGAYANGLDYDENDINKIILLSNLDSKIESAGYAASFGDKVKAQAFLDKATSICDDINRTTDSK